jgi:phosphoribosyl 1,2-cyclic phosphate phosphodiesterase
MRVILLGTGGSAGVPMIGGPDGSGNWGVCDPPEPRNSRTRASIVVESGEGTRLLVDTSPDMRTQLLACQVPRDDVRILNRIVGRPLDAFATRATLDEMTRRFGYAFRPWQPPGFFRPVLVAREVTAGETVTAAGMQVRLFEQDHGFIPSLGLRIGGFGYSTDVVDLDDAAFAALQGVDTWVVGCFLRRGPHKTHADLPQVLSWAQRVGARRTVLTHMGTDMDWRWLGAHLPQGVEAGHDGLVLDLT